MSRWLSALILITFALLGSFSSQGQERPQGPGELYDSGMELFHKGKYDEAIDRFSKLILFFSTSKLHSYSRYMIGQCYLKMKKYEEALQQFELYLKNFPNGDRAKEAEKGMQTSKEKLKEKASPPSLQPNPPDEAPKETDEVNLSTPQPKDWALLKTDPERRLLVLPEGQSLKAVGEVKTLSSNKKVKRRICVQVFDLDVMTLEEVEKGLKALKPAGVDTVLLRVFQNRGGRIFKFLKPRYEEGVYFETQYAPVVANVLGRITEMAHQNGLDLFAWMTTRYANYGMEGPSEYRCMSYNFETKKMEVARGFNLFHPDVLDRLEGLFRDLGRYPIDGILFQDDLILKHNEDFSREANKAFLKEFGYSPHPNRFYIDPYKSNSGKYYVRAYTSQFWTWASWKNRWLMDVAKRLMEAARESNPNLEFGINLYYETLLNSANGTAWFSQTLSKALERNFDYYAFMAYHRQTMRELDMGERRAIELMGEVTEKAVKQVGDPSRVLMKIQLFDWNSNEVIPQKEVEEVLAGVLNHGPISLAFVPYVDQFDLRLLRERWSANK